jgi:glutamate-1-semialdehyde 2,1-aminomutase
MSSTTESRFALSSELFEKSRRYLSGGVSSGLRSASKPLPLFFRSGSGSRLIDVDGNKYIDYTLAWGPLILGHCDPALNQAVIRQLATLQQVGAQHELEWQVAQKICEMVPCADQVVFSNTGSEAVQIAIRLARAYTGRRKLIRFEGHYHGWLDNVMTGYRPDIRSLETGVYNLPTLGMNGGVLDEIVIVPWNDLGAVKAVLEAQGEQLAAILTEPILCNTSCLMPGPGFLEGLRRLSTEYGVALIFDEVITGFRVAAGGAQEYFGVTPDLATFGKAVAAGFTLSAVAGKQEIMRLIDERRVAHAGTFNGNPIVLAAAYETLTRIDRDSGSLLKRIRETGNKLIAGLRSSAAKHGIPILINGVGSVFHISFTRREAMANYRDTLESNFELKDSFIEAMLHAGAYLLPDGRWYLGAAHSYEDVEDTVAWAGQCFASLE